MGAKFENLAFVRGGGDLMLHFSRFRPSENLALVRGGGDLIVGGDLFLTWVIYIYISYLTIGNTSYYYYVT